MTRDEDKYTDFEGVEFIAATDKAVRVEIEGDQYWVPKSQISEDSEIDGDSKKGDVGTLIATKWWAEQENLE